jgi:hypothetical protein
MFKYLNGWSTPGEAITGLSSSSGMPGLYRLAHECSYGFLQYTALAFSLVFASVAMLLVISLLSNILHAFGTDLSTRAYDFVLPLLLVLWPLTTFFLLTFAYLPKSRTDPTTSIDAACGHAVERHGSEAEVPAIDPAIG